MEIASKCLVFDLPSGAGGMAAGMYKGQLTKAINNFCSRHSIDYVAKTHRYTFKIWFNEDAHYTFFLLGFDWTSVWRKPYLADENYAP